MAENKNIFGAHHLADNLSLYEVQRSNNFEFQVGFDVAGKILKAGTSTTQDSDYLDGATSQEVLRIAVSKASVPHFQQEVITIRRGNSAIKAAGTVTFPSGTLTLVDYIGADVKSILQAWRALSYNVVSDTIGAMKDYKFNCVLSEYTPSYELVRYWDLKGCWISGLEEDDFDMDSGDKRMVRATVEYDYAIPHLPDVVNEQ